jgi:hypothetical protein
MSKHVAISPREAADPFAVGELVGVWIDERALS